MPIEQSSREFEPERISAVARQLLDASALCAIATVGSGGEAYVNTAYFASDADFDVVWISDPHAEHSKNLSANATAAIAVYDSGQTWTEPDRGIQLFGSAKEVTGHAVDDAQALYGHRFPAYDRDTLSGYRCYRFRTRRMKLFDEYALGSGVFVTATVRGGGQITVERTLIYRPKDPLSPP